jgi:hypothetical protein
MILVKQYNNGKNTEFNLEQLNNDLEPGEYIIKTQGVSKNGKKSPESEGVTFRVSGTEVKIGNYTYRTDLVNIKDILKAGSDLVDYKTIDPDEQDPDDYNLYIEENGKYYFNSNAISYLIDNAETIFPGWHIPTEAEMVDLLSSYDITISDYSYDRTPLEEVEKSLKLLLNNFKFDTTTWDNNCFNLDYNKLTNDSIFATTDGYTVYFENDGGSIGLHWDTLYDCYCPQLFLCKNH